MWIFSICSATVSSSILGGVQQENGFPLKINLCVPAAFFQCICQLCADFLVWNKCSLCSLVVGQISQVNEQGQHIIFSFESHHAILERI